MLREVGATSYVSTVYTMGVPWSPLYYDGQQPMDKLTSKLSKGLDTLWLLDPRLYPDDPLMTLNEKKRKSLKLFIFYTFLYIFVFDRSIYKIFRVWN